VTVHYLGYYIKWTPQECYYYAAEHTAFEANTERTEGTYSKYNSIDDKTDPEPDLVVAEAVARHFGLVFSEPRARAK